MRRLLNIEFAPTKLLFLISLLFVAGVLAQAPKLPALPNTSTDGKSSASATSTATPSKTSSKAETTTKEASSTKETITSSESPPETNLPPITTTSATAALGGLLTGLPKLPEDDYPAPTVPPTANAPFMQKSTLPDGTVFICVGAFLGFVAFIVIAWRGLVAWSIHRSVRRAALAQSSKYRRDKVQPNNGHSKANLYNSHRGSTLSFDQLRSPVMGGNNANGNANSNANANASANSNANSTRESLFFSPTAGGGMQGGAKRGSGYLPAGYYAAGNSAPGGGMGMTHIGGGGSGLSNPNHRYSRARSMGPSPPRSPSLPPSRGNDGGLGRPSTVGLSMHASNSSLNLSVPPQGRAPSAYLEDLFESHPSGSDLGMDRRRP